MALEIREFTYNHFHNILRRFVVEPDFPFTTSERKREVASRVAEGLRT